MTLKLRNRYKFLDMNSPAEGYTLWDLEKIMIEIEAGRLLIDSNVSGK